MKFIQFVLALLFFIEQHASKGPFPQGGEFCNCLWLKLLAPLQVLCESMVKVR